MHSRSIPEKPRVLVLVGPTCSGKTSLALALAARINGEIVSADSRQIYRHLTIGTAKPTPEERATTPHHFVDLLEPSEEFNAGHFGEEGRRVIKEVFARGATPIVVGGSGLYVRSLIDGLFVGPGADKEYRSLLERRLESEGIDALVEDLRHIDPESARRIDPTKPRRIIRALEVFHLTGEPLSRLHDRQQIAIPFEPILFGLAWERGELYKRIEARCDAMIAAGLLNEVEQIAALGYDDRVNALNTVGYAEVFAYRRGEIAYEEMLRLFKQNSRRYAKRQLTWFRRDERVFWMTMNDESSSEAIADTILKKISYRESHR
jgi:tRNA dimethylallyltransferase